MFDLFSFEHLAKNTELIPLATGIYAFTGLMISTIFKSIIDWYINKSKIRADIIVKARLQWINEVRELCSIIISQSRKTIYYHNLFFKLESDLEKKEILNKALNNYLEMINNKNKLTLYLPDHKKKRIKILKYERVIQNKDNRQFQSISMRLLRQTKEIYSYMKKGGYPDSHTRREVIKNYNDLTREFSEIGSNYIKNEWEKAKRNK